VTAQTVSGPAESYRIRPGALLRAASDAIPPSGLVLLAVLSVQFGAGLAKNLFAQLPPTAVVFLRIATGALIMCAVGRPRLRGLTRQDWFVGIAFGAIKTKGFRGDLVSFELPPEEA